MPQWVKRVWWMVRPRGRWWLLWRRVLRRRLLWLGRRRFGCWGWVESCCRGWGLRVGLLVDLAAVMGGVHCRGGGRWRGLFVVNWVVLRVAGRHRR